MKRPYVNFRELKAAVPIVKVLERYGLLEPLKERGEALSGPCPFCEGETSFRVNTEKSCFHCFSCRAGGNMLDLVALKEECSVRDAALKVAEWFDVETSRPSRGREARGRSDAAKRESPAKGRPGAGSTREEKVAQAQDGSAAAPANETPPEVPSPPDACHPENGAEKTPHPPNRPLTFELKLDLDHPWFAEAGLLPETVREFGLGFCSKGMMAGRVCFPIRNASGELLGYAGRWPGDGPPEGQPVWRYPKGLDLSQVVYPAEKLADTETGSELFAGDPLRVVLAWQMGLEHVFFVPGSFSLEECGRVLSRTRS